MSVPPLLSASMIPKTGPCAPPTSIPSPPPLALPPTLASVHSSGTTNHLSKVARTIFRNLRTLEPDVTPTVHASESEKAFYDSCAYGTLIDCTRLHDVVMKVFGCRKTVSKQHMVTIYKLVEDLRLHSIQVANALQGVHEAIHHSDDHCILRAYAGFIALWNAFQFKRDTHMAVIRDMSSHTATPHCERHKEQKDHINICQSLSWLKNIIDLYKAHVAESDATNTFEDIVAYAFQRPDLSSVPFVKDIRRIFASEKNMVRLHTQHKSIITQWLESNMPSSKNTDYRSTATTTALSDCCVAEKGRLM